MVPRRRGPAASPGHTQATQGSAGLAGRQRERGRTWAGDFTVVSQEEMGEQV